MVGVKVAVVGREKVIRGRDPEQVLRAVLEESRDGFTTASLEVRDAFAIFGIGRAEFVVRLAQQEPAPEPEYLLLAGECHEQLGASINVHARLGYRTTGLALGGAEGKPGFAVLMERPRGPHQLAKVLARQSEDAAAREPAPTAPDRSDPAVRAAYPALFREAT